MKDWITNFANEFFERKIKYAGILSFLFTILYFYGDVVVNQRNITVLYATKYLLIFAIYYLAIYFFNYFIHFNKKIIRINIDEYLFKYTFIFLLIVWFPHLIIRYPISNNWDTYQQLLQGLGYEPLGAHYPLFHTLLMTAFYRFGLLLGDANKGMFLFAFIETAILDLIFSYATTVLRKRGLSDLLLIVFLVFYGFCPYVVGYVGHALYDIYYSGFFVLFLTMIVEYVFDREKFFKNNRNLLLLLCSAILMVLFRKNGIYVIVPTAVVLLVMEIKRSKVIDKRIIVILLLLVFPYMCNKGLEMYYKPIKGSVREALSLPFQQTARFVKYHSDLVTEEEKEIINKILPYESLGDLYKEYISDPVKGKFNDDASTEDLINYFKVWFKQFFKSPLTYFDATGRQNIYLFYPRYSTYVYFIDCNNGRVENQDDGLLQTPLVIKNNQESYLEYLYFFHLFPPLYFINNMATFVLLFVTVILLTHNEKKKELFIIYLPIFISLLIIIAAPGIATHVRYSFPIIYSFPLWVSALNICKEYNNK